MNHTCNSMETALKAVKQIDGWLTQHEAMTLYDLASQAKGAIVEIGSWKGRSTAALALGSMAGNQQPVYAIDSFVGVPPLDRPSASGTRPGWNSSSPEILRANLDAAGINGLVTIISKASIDAANDVGECGLLFVDGNHKYSAVKRDLETYLPKLQVGGHVVIHDVYNGEPGVVQAVDEILTADPTKWRAQWRADSAVVFQRRETTKRSILLGFPGSTLCYGAAKGLLQATLGAHDVQVEQSGIGWDDMNRLWVYALNMASRGKITHFAMLHSDIMPSPGWIDLLIDELDDHDADMISVVAAIKDEQGLTSCGIGDKDNNWAPFRRFTMKELMQMPETFGIADTPHPDRYLLHNSGCFAVDLRKRIWRSTDTDGYLWATFTFPIAAKLQPDGTFQHLRESEDWYFSRRVAELGAKTLATRKVTTVHYGQAGYRNDYPWGKLEHDEPTRDNWEPKPA